MKRTPSQNKQLHALCGKLNISSEQKADLVYSYTNGRETSSAEMFIPEAQALINALNHIGRTSIKEQKPTKPRPVKDAENNMRRKILSICHEMKWTDKGHLDWTRINAWLLKYGYLKKPLNDYTASELPKLITQFEELLKHYYAAK